MRSVHDLQQAADGDAGPFKRLVAWSLLRLLHQLGNALGLLALAIVIQRLVVGLDLALDHMAVHEEVFVLRRFCLLHLPVRINVLHNLVRRVGVVLADLIEFLLVLLHLAHQLVNIRKWRLPGLLGDTVSHGEQAENRDNPKEKITTVHEQDWPLVTQRCEVARTKEGTQLLLTRMVAQKRTRVIASRVMIATNKSRSWMCADPRRGEGPAMFRALIHWVLSAIAVLVTAQFVPGFYVNDIHSAMLAAVVIGVLNATLGFAMKVITFPFAILTFGIFLIFINASMILLASKMVSGLTVYGWVPAFWGAVVLAVLGMLIRSIMRDE